jgi:hypothetical protein
VSDPLKNEGEGSRSGAKQYDDAATHHAEKGDTESEARDAARDLADPAKRKDLQQAESTGRERSKGEDPQLRQGEKDTKRGAERH